MKHLIFAVAIFFLTLQTSQAQQQPPKIVFDITSGDTATHQRVIRWVKGISEAHPDAKIQIVFYGKALPMVVKDKSTVASDVINLATSKKVSFVVCGYAMKVFKIEKSQLLDGVTTVPDALIELTSKQAEGYGYIKVTD